MFSLYELGAAKYIFRLRRSIDSAVRASVHH
jgi:hypothetical protein